MELRDAVRRLGFGNMELRDAVRRLGFGDTELRDAVRRLGFGNRELRDAVRRLGFRNMELRDPDSLAASTAIPPARQHTFSTTILRSNCVEHSSAVFFC